MGLNILKKKNLDSKKILYKLIQLYGINKFQSKKICKNIGINFKTKTNKLKNYQLNNLNSFIKKNYIVNQFFKDNEKQKYNFLSEIKIIRSIRQQMGLPVKGQRTHSNAKTIKSFFLKKKKNILNKKKYDKRKKK